MADIRHWPDMLMHSAPCTNSSSSSGLCLCICAISAADSSRASITRAKPSRSSICTPGGVMHAHLRGCVQGQFRTDLPRKSRGGEVLYNQRVGAAVRNLPDQRRRGVQLAVQQQDIEGYIHRTPRARQ